MHSCLVDRKAIPVGHSFLRPWQPTLATDVKVFLCINYAVEHRVQMKKEEIHQHFDETLAKQAHL